MKKIIFTKQGFKDLKEKSEALKKERPAAVLDLKKAREMGDLSENGYYKSARFKLNDIDRSIRFNNYLIKNAQICEPTDIDSVQTGLTVILDEKGKEKKYQIVGSYESNPEIGKISFISPVGKQLMNKKVGDKVEINVGRNQLVFTIKKIIY